MVIIPQFGLLMRHRDHSDAIAFAAVVESDGLRGLDVRGGFVEKGEPRPADQHARNVDKLLLSKRELCYLERGVQRKQGSDPELRDQSLEMGGCGIVGC